MQTTPVISPAGSGKTIRAFGEEVILHLGGEQTDGAFALWTEITPPGGGPPPHYHEREDETFYVLEGRIAFFRDGEWEEVPVGTVAHMPKKSVHTFKNLGETPAPVVLHWDDLLIQGPRAVRDLWSRREEGIHDAELTAVLPPHGMKLVRLRIPE